jgi:molecular chaperone GrpE
VTAENKEIVEEEVSAQADAGPDEAAALREECENLKAERDELKDRLLRHQAEFDNFRKRSEKERSDSAQFAGKEMVKEILPVFDDFERALKVETADSDYAKGIGMIYGRLFEALKKQGLEPIETEGAMFDPYLHQAIERVETKDAKDNAILGEFQRGYNFKGKLLRPAMVKVAVHP